MKRKIFVFVGTRPEAIKMASVIKALRERVETFDTTLVSTGQHQEMLTQTLADFALTPDIDLGLMTANQSLAQLSAHLFGAVDAVLEKGRPDMILVQGDTTTVMVASLCAFYKSIPCAHVEAGLRSYDMRAPFPEELNRRIATLATTLHFAPTPEAVAVLRAEGTSANSIYLTGNTCIDALLWTAEDILTRPPPLPQAVQTIIDSKRRFVLITGHRRENFGKGLASICRALRKLASLHPDVFFLYPVHLNPNVRDVVYQELSGEENLVLTTPLAYRQFVSVMQSAYCLLTDSGGIQEEAPSLKKPVLVMRDVTERPEGIRAGCSRLVGTDSGKIIQEVTALLDNTSGIYEHMIAVRNPYGDGRAATRIVDVLRIFFEDRN